MDFRHTLEEATADWWGRIHFPINVVAPLDIHMGKDFPTLVPYHAQINSIFIKNLYVKSKTKKPFKGECLHDLRVEKNFSSPKRCKEVIYSTSLECGNFVHQTIHKDDDKSQIGKRFANWGEDLHHPLHKAEYPEYIENYMWGRTTNKDHTE